VNKCPIISICRWHSSFFEIGDIGIDREPGVPLDERAPDADQMHDRKHAGTPEIVLLGGAVIGKEAPHLRVTPEAGWCQG
jgi:hypothetical protein